MADVAITKAEGKIKVTAGPNTPVEYPYTDLAAGDNAVIDCDFKDEFTQIHFLGGSAKSTVTIKFGNGYAGVQDEVFELGASKYMALTLDSATFKNVSGTYKGKVVISPSAACKIAVVEARV